MFFTTGGTEAVETAWKVAKQYFKLTGKPGKHKVISRSIAYHGTTQGALAITGLPKYKAPFEPVTPGGFRVPNTNFYRAPEPFHTDLKAFGQWAADRIAEAIEFEGPDTVAAVFLEPVQNAGGSIPPPPGYFERVREICDEYDVLLVSDEVICAFGRIGSMFACCDIGDVGYVPDMITCAKGMTSGYSPIGAMIASERLFEPFNDGNTMFPHGYTFGGHPVSAAVGLANLDIFEREGLNDHVKTLAPDFRATLEKLYDLPIVGDVRGEGFFYGVELVKDKATKQTFTDDRTPRAARPSVVGPFRGRVVLPHRRPRRFRHPAGAAADQRPSRVRHHRSDPAQCADAAQAALGVAGHGARKPRIDPIRWQPPPSTAATRSRPGGDAARRRAARQRPRRMSSPTPSGNIWTGVEDGRIVRITPDGSSAHSGRRHRRATVGPGSRP